MSLKSCVWGHCLLDGLSEARFRKTGLSLGELWIWISSAFDEGDCEKMR